jgi:hypothetical protein
MRLNRPLLSPQPQLSQQEELQVVWQQGAGAEQVSQHDFRENMPLIRDHQLSFSQQLSEQELQVGWQQVVC